MNGRLRQNRKDSGRSAKGDEQAAAPLSQRIAQMVANGHESHIDSREEQHKPHIGKAHADGDPFQSLDRQFQQQELTQQEERSNEAQGKGHLLSRMDKGMQKASQHISCHGKVGNRVGKVIF